MNLDFEVDYSIFDRTRDGLIPAIIQEEKTKHVLMLGYISADSFKKTLETELVWFYSRSRQTLWQKGESSGNILNVRSIKLDCDQDTFLIKVTALGNTCHKGTKTCFGNIEDE